ncbi:CRISPR system Cascade subunit CasC [Azospirillum lipoferum]|uniref:Type I-E CRISPR-associated protein Cas7/Cse4/CasC n=1 Tax=Azospirillum lipoferum TaxID=193 RepID=A0A5A9GIR8_AZOLI|nr:MULTISPECIES: type I-E CRISPR-associated protein Cas7/Cse4/CasC [Azospirillum]KAA0593119.1 type I-E CRISPR-associated protein Cas7/Cse4/CasC [Azospirillum lipoferum]MCP1613521.1 CRISPR system Cascade subunit CasC [Azospirillum lipoferum]MDW5532290.1 type I-E CRISPR-associated protein Cas7/Cse4/CasC [Azospirillum sp. NL1]
MNIIQISAITPVGPGCVVRDDAGRPKSAVVNNVQRLRIPSQSRKRALRTSTAFFEALDGQIGIRTQRVGDLLIKRLKGEFGEERATDAVMNIVSVFGKAKSDKAQTEQLAFIAPEELDAAEALARRVLGGEKVEDKDYDALIRNTVRAVDIALFGRMFADRGEARITAAVSMAHSISVGRAPTENDFYVAIDDKKPPEEDVGAGFMGHQGFTAGVVLEWSAINVDQLLKNLGGDVDLAKRAVSAYIRGLATTFPSGKVSSFGTHARPTWMMAEMGNAAPRNLVAAIYNPIDEGDQIAIAVERVTKVAKQFDKIYGENLQRVSFNVLTGEGSLDEVVSVASTFVAG